MAYTTEDLADPIANAKAIALCEGSTDALGAFFRWANITHKQREFYRTMSDDMARQRPPQPYVQMDKKAAKRKAKPEPEDDEPDVNAFGEAPGSID